MAAGDIIAGRNNAAFDFQPAAGVEIMITMASCLQNNWLLVKDSTGTNYFQYFTSTTPIGNFKVGITNTNYLSFTVSGAYSGIQIK